MMVKMELILFVVNLFAISFCLGYTIPSSNSASKAKMTRMQLFKKKAPAPVVEVASQQLTAAISIFRKQLQKPDLSDQVVASAFKVLTKTLDGNEGAALTIVTKFPAILAFIPQNDNAQKVQQTFEIYVEKWGLEKATQVVSRNPPLLCVRPTGKYSAGESGEDTVVISYVIDATRAYGKQLLFLLFALLVSKGLGLSPVDLYLNK